MPQLSTAKTLAGLVLQSGMLVGSQPRSPLAGHLVKCGPVPSTWTRQPWPVFLLLQQSVTSGMTNLSQGFSPSCTVVSKVSELLGQQLSLALVWASTSLIAD